MKVFINDKVYDSEEQPILLLLSEADKKNIANMGDRTKYCSYPDFPKWTDKNYEPIKKWMEGKE